jgi:hypothetical protein
MVKRINEMNKLFKKIKGKPFSYYDGFYHIHGSHKGRTKYLKLDTHIILWENALKEHVPYIMYFIYMSRVAILYSLLFQIPDNFTIF